MGNPWKKAASVAELGQLTADWLEGRIRTSPMNVGDSGPDEETRHLIPVLAACNRAGCVTSCSQPGMVDRGQHWEQRAAIEAWVADKNLLDRIRTSAKRAGIEVIAHRADSGWRDGEVVTRVDGEPYTWFGRTMGRRGQIAYEWPGVGGRAVRELRTATYLTLIDPVWGRDNVLWPALANAIRG
ncbi:DUF6919 domain-containing protein [Streptomyces antimycoticus]|uniref:DUF6919 domain-containing protein n=1 Tax=Streptomyces antimycoticus TaxID=68175 RepID=UPI00386657DE|nr:hypothetical protein OG751_04095 [Streptomyces antimycoticus]